jgi:hypothetical protein
MLTEIFVTGDKDGILSGEIASDFISFCLHFQNYRQQEFPLGRKKRLRKTGREEMNSLVFVLCFIYHGDRKVPCGKAFSSE